MSRSTSALIHELFGEDSDQDEVPTTPFGEDYDQDEVPTTPAADTVHENYYTVSTPVETMFGGDNYSNDIHSTPEDITDNENGIHSTPGEDIGGEDNYGNESPSNPAENIVENETRLIEPGNLFSSIDSLFEAYQEHARSKNFSVVKRTESVGYARMVCDRAGTSKAQKCSKRIGCKVRLNTKKLDNGSCVITSMVNEHNHEIDPAFSPLMPAHRQLTMNINRQLEANDIAGLRPCKNVRLCEVQCDGPQNLGCLAKDYRNYIEERRRLRLGVGDAEAIRNIYGGQITQRRSRVAYEEFHDAVSFDTTYLVNRYKMPFASIVGINHHGHSILLGCALVTHESAESFIWLFQNWLLAMGDIHPTAIITDQCESIGKAIKELMPNTIHRFCIWHILFKLPTKFQGVADYQKCSVEFKGIVYESLTIQTFETKWAEFLVKYGMENNSWLTDLYDEREKWVPIYLHHTFWAGMVSTQRSEGMHAYFDEFVHSRSTLKQFMEQYDMAIEKKIEKEYSILRAE